MENVKAAFHIGVDEANLTEEYMSSGSFLRMPSLNNEREVLSVAGTSRVFKELGFSSAQSYSGLLEVVWLNQTKCLRFFVLEENEELIRKYAESLVRRNFGTADAMKPGRPPEPLLNENAEKSGTADVMKSGRPSEPHQNKNAEKSETADAMKPGKPSEPHRNQNAEPSETADRDSARAVIEKSMKRFAVVLVIITILFFIFILIFMT
ncbi:MAG: hypothetical protein K5697_16095 [Lachnospiraceae bacterium]|nr:hypothetical protein [Lachnospiraceae bacterium]